MAGRRSGNRSSNRDRRQLRLRAAATAEVVGNATIPFRVVKHNASLEKGKEWKSDKSWL